MVADAEVDHDALTVAQALYMEEGRRPGLSLQVVHSREEIGSCSVHGSRHRATDLRGSSSKFERVRVDNDRQITGITIDVEVFLRTNQGDHQLPGTTAFRLPAMVLICVGCLRAGPSPASP